MALTRGSEDISVESVLSLHFYVRFQGMELRRAGAHVGQQVALATQPVCVVLQGSPGLFYFSHYHLFSSIDEV